MADFTITWRKPTTEEHEFVCRHWIPEMLQNPMQWSSDVEAAIESGRFDVCRFTSIDVKIAHSDSNDVGYIDILVGNNEKKRIPIPLHFAKYFTRKNLTQRDILLIKLHGLGTWLSVPAREGFL